jgi:vesicle transport through interaction with t-SNAREs 1
MDRANATCYRMATNRIITIAIITVLVLLILGIIYSKFK